ncbi:MAG TPA: hypothetical protein PKH77_11735 [Anaerolineae bacterium]|nr:hypothetical protein [Anaerolineae bacterium]
MSRTHKEQIIDFLWAIAPRRASNADIRVGTGISSAQQVYLLTRELWHTGLIQGESTGKESRFWADETPDGLLTSVGPVAPGTARAQGVATLSPQAFTVLAQTVLSGFFGVTLQPGIVAGVPHCFELVSPAGDIVGDSLYYPQATQYHWPPAKFAVISERVWLLAQTAARIRFLVFGNDRDIPELWLRRYGALTPDVAFYFLSAAGQLECLNDARHSPLVS